MKKFETKWIGLGVLFLLVGMSQVFASEESESFARLFTQTEESDTPEETVSAWYEVELLNPPQDPDDSFRNREFRKPGVIGSGIFGGNSFGWIMDLRLNRILTSDVTLGGRILMNSADWQSRNPGIVAREFSAALRVAFGEHVEVGVRYVSSGSALSQEYAQSLRDFGYDVRINLFTVRPKNEHDRVRVFMNITGISKSSAAPTLYRVGAIWNFK